MSTTYIKKRIHLLNLLINCISARSSTQTLSTKDECTSVLLNFLTNGLLIFQLTRNTRNITKIFLSKNL